MSNAGVEAARECSLCVAFCDVVRTIALALDMDEQGKLGHATRVALLAYRVGQALGVDDAGPLYYAGLLHDLGAIGLEDHVVHQMVNGGVSEEVRAHAGRGASLVRPLAVLRPYESLIRDHHERYDGTGFPAGKQGDSISLGASIIHLSDLVDIATRTAASQTRAQRVARLVTDERGAGVPARVADATAEVLFGPPRLLDVLADERALEAASVVLCPRAPGLERVTRWELLSQVLWVLARVVDAKHAYTMGHSTRVAHLGFRIASALGAPVDAWDVAWAGLLHDVGKIGVPRRLLDKRGELDASEWRTIRGHAAASERVIATIRDLAPLALSAASHHERYDGKGYPRGLKGEGIPLIGRILAYADIYDALTSERAYRAPMLHGEALDHVRGLVGKNLDPHLADAAFEGLSDPTERDARLFARFFEHDDADMDATFGKSAGSGTILRASRGDATVASCDPWTRLELTRDLELRSGADDLGRLTGASAEGPLGAHFEPDSMRALRAGAARLEADEVFTQYVLTRSGMPVETVLQWHGDAMVLLCRAADDHVPMAGARAGGSRTKD